MHKLCDLKKGNVKKRSVYFEKQSGLQNYLETASYCPKQSNFALPQLKHDTWHGLGGTWGEKIRPCKSAKFVTYASRRLQKCPTLVRNSQSTSRYVGYALRLKPYSGLPAYRPKGLYRPVGCRYIFFNISSYSTSFYLVFFLFDAPSNCASPESVKNRVKIFS